MCNNALDDDRMNRVWVPEHNEIKAFCQEVASGRDEHTPRFQERKENYEPDEGTDYKGSSGGKQKKQQRKQHGKPNSKQIEQKQMRHTKHIGKIGGRSECRIVRIGHDYFEG
ncbi:hypothetical protein BPAE_0083g00500 [Botrytis paeoniae]|uniref:Uncharacterized protein n=1 Tax=Botrytis paeoniae TaxID=278948 RepID=A0A4Z1FP56_9HELO|nr:hypothetical protein BPAE_0083g00500 [Botrytis paeoniae]